MVEGQHEELVAGIEQLEQEAVDRRPRVLDAPAEHAVADVEQDAEADRHAVARELRDRLRLAVLEHLERVAVQACDQPPVRVAHGRGDARQLDAGSERTPVLRSAAVRDQNAIPAAQPPQCGLQQHAAVAKGRDTRLYYPACAPRN